MKRLLMCVVCAFTGSVNAGGFQISETSVFGLGNGFSSIAADPADLGGIFQNPALLSEIDRPVVKLSASILTVEADFDLNSATLDTPVGTLALTGREADGGDDAVVPSFSTAYPLNDRWTLGLSVSAPFGLRTEYNRRWVGRYSALESELITTDINPSVAYQISDGLSFGFGVSAQYADATLSQAVFAGIGSPDGFSEVTGDDWSFGFNAGIRGEYRGLEWGLGYRSAVKHKLDGDLEAQAGPAHLDVAAEADLDLPETFYGTLRYPIHQAIDVSVGVRWTRWSRFNEIRIQRADGAPDQVTELEWENSVTASVGVDWRMNNRWAVRAGYVYDATPIPSAARRTPRIPDADRQWFTVGASWQGHPNWRVHGAFARIIGKSASVTLVEPIAAGVQTSIAGEFDDLAANIFAMEFTYVFSK